MKIKFIFRTFLWQKEFVSKLKIVHDWCYMTDWPRYNDSLLAKFAKLKNNPETYSIVPMKQICVLLIEYSWFIRTVKTSSVWRCISTNITHCECHRKLWWSGLCEIRSTHYLPVNQNSFDCLEIVKMNHLCDLMLIRKASLLSKIPVMFPTRVALNLLKKSF